MQLDQEVIIQPPPFSDHNGKVISPDPIRLTALNVTYLDNPTEQTLYAMITPIPQRILLVNGKDYVALGDYTHSILENLLKEKLGDNIGVKLRSLFPKTLEENPNGPGSILAGMFHLLGIKSSPTCSCKKHAIEMNDKGIEWCEQNISTIVDWLKEESSKRKIPFIESVAILVIKRAIRQSKRALTLK